MEKGFWQDRTSSILLSLILGFVIWLSAVSKEVPIVESIRPGDQDGLIELQMEGLPEAYSVDVRRPPDIQVQLRGLYTRIDQVSASDLNRRGRSLWCRSGARDTRPPAANILPKSLEMLAKWSAFARFHAGTDRSSYRPNHHSQLRNRCPG